MEVRGIKLDREVLESMQEELEMELQSLEKRAHELAGEAFNLNSPQQLSRILFEVLKLPPQKRTKTGFATDIGVLTALCEIHPIADTLVRYRELSKLLNTYVSVLPKLVDPVTNRLHTCFNQTVTATGRLSSSNPNLQNIPVRTELGKTIRKAFIPSSRDGMILSADYSQIELRVMAHLSGDEGLKMAFAEGRDIHASTASEVFDVPFDEITAEHRRKAKAINFGIIYGISPFGLAEQLGIDQAEAEDYITEYFREFPGVRDFLDRQVEEATRTGFVTTILGRRREIPELAEGNVRMRRLGERLAFNTPIQGSAADIIKVAMLRIHRRLMESGCRSYIILQVHDELVCDVEINESEEVGEIVRSEMEGACELDVPLKVDMGLGPSWYDVK
jgi:DNA polymerase-1